MTHTPATLVDQFEDQAKDRKYGNLIRSLLFALQCSVAVRNCLSLAVLNFNIDVLFYSAYCCYKAKEKRFV